MDFIFEENKIRIYCSLLTLKKEVIMTWTPVTGFLAVRQTVSPVRFLQIAKLRPDSIKRSHFVAPKIGRSGDFGHIEIEYFHATKR